MASDRDDKRGDTGTPINATLSDSSVSLDRIFDLLADTQRRELLRFLIDREEEIVETDECVEALAESLEDAPDERSLQAMLHHVHLPKLSNAMVVDYDNRNAQIRYWGDERIHALLEHATGLEDDDR